MKELDKKIIQLRDQTWEVARESLDGGETRIYRSLTDIAEKLTKLIGSFDKSPIPINKKAEMLSIFARYKGERYEAKIDTARIHGGRGQCVLMEGFWCSTSGSAGQITNTKVDGWTKFWRYIDESSNTEQPIDRLRSNK